MYKRWISLFLVMILTVSMVLPGNAVALTTDAQENTELASETTSETTEITSVTEPSKPTETTGTTAPSEPAETAGATEPSEPAETTGTTEPGEPAETAGATEPSEPAETAGATEPSEPAETAGTTEPSEPTDATDVTEPSESTEATDAIEPGEPTDPSDVVPDWIEDTLLDEGISVMSMRPIEEINCYLVLNNFTEEQLAALTIDDVLASLQDSNGNSIAIPETATTVWRYVLDETDHIETYQTYTIGSGDAFDISYPDGATAIQLELIIGSGGQLSAGNIRYIIKVYVSSMYSENLNFEIYAYNSDTGNVKVEPAQSDFSIVPDSGYTDSAGNPIPVWTYGYALDEVITCEKALLNLTSELTLHPDVTMEVYVEDEFLLNNQLGFELFPPITDQILNQDMSQVGAGYQFTADANTFVVLYYIDGVQVDMKFVGVLIAGGYVYYTGEMSADVEGQITNITYNTTHSDEMDENGVWTIECELNAGYPLDGNYYFNLGIEGGGQITDNFNMMATKAVVGHYSTLEEASDQPDIKDALLNGQGYQAEYSEGVNFTVFFPEGTFTDGDVKKFTVKTIAHNDTWREYTDAPIIGEEDPWFRVTGVNDANGNALDVYIVENGETINMDTSYGYGNQTIFINDNDVDLTQLRPTIWRADSDRITVYVNGILYNEGDIIDCSDMVTFTAIIDGHQKTYNVNFMKKSSGPELYVFGSTTREVLLDEYFEKKHDILIANMGDAELTGLRVELDATNCQLDEYWTIGGTGNDTLAPFTETSSDTEYGELNNLAKIRLIPVDEKDMVGNGEIEGTLSIYADYYADGQEPIVVITLTGQALNPQITTNQESFASYTAVKYVPYAYVITTSNMHDWIDTSFTMTGDLPAGMEFYPETGEIYGVPQETGEFNIRIEASFESETSGFEASSIDLTLTVLDNTNENVYEASDANYQIKQHVGTQTGDYDFVLETIEDTVFTSYGEFGEFVDIWLNGEKLIEGVHYTKEEGSTKITIKSQTIEDKANDDGSENTIAMEFRTDTDGDGNANDDGDLNRTAQNFTVKSAVEKVIEQIAALPTNINLSHKSQVQAARAAYNALSEADKAKVTNYSKLTAAENTIAQLEANQSAANKVIKMINDLPATITLNDKDAVVAARAAYDALTSAQKNLVTNYDRLQKAEVAIAQLEAEHAENEKNKAAAKVVVDMIDALPSPVTLADKDAVSAARAAYNSLTADQKGYVTNYDKLTAAEAAIAQLEAADKEKAEVNAVIVLINEIPNPVTLDDKDTVEAAREAYDALSAEQQEDVVNYKALTDAEATIAALEAQKEADEADKTAADAVIGLIDAIPDPVTLEDKNAVEAAREAYDALTDTQKQLVSNYSDLTDAEDAIKALEDYAAAEEADREAADAVIKLIDELPEEVSLNDKAQVEEARRAYDNLTENQQRIVTNYDKLIAAETKIAELEDSEYEETQSVTLVAIFVDSEGKPLADTAIELHSVVQNGRTDENGSILFTGVEFGDHTIFTMDANGSATAQKSFSIVSGTPLGMNGNVITAENGAVFTITIEKNGSELTFLSVEEGNQAPEVDTDKDDDDSGIDIGESDDDNHSSQVPDSSVPQTADEAHLMFWNTMMFASFTCFLLVPIFFGRKRGKYEKRR